MTPEPPMRHHDPGPERDREPDRLRAASVSERAEHLLSTAPPDELDQEWIDATQPALDQLRGLAGPLAALAPPARYVAEHLVRLAAGTVTVRDLFTGLPRHRFPRVDDLLAVLDVLAAAGWVTLIPPSTRRRPGRPPGPTIVLHPPRPRTAS